MITRKIDLVVHVSIIFGRFEYCNMWFSQVSFDGNLMSVETGRTEINVFMSKNLYFLPKLWCRYWFTYTYWINSSCFLKEILILGGCRIFIFIWFWERIWERIVVITIILATIYTTTRKVSVFRVFLVLIFPHLEWIPRDALYLSVFGPNAEKCRLEKLWIRTIFSRSVPSWRINAVYFYYY